MSSKTQEKLMQAVAVFRKSPYFYLDEIQITVLYNLCIMGQPTEKDFERASRMLRSSVLDYREAVACLRIMKAFLHEDMIPSRQLNQFRHIINRYIMTGRLEPN